MDQPRRRILVVDDDQKWGNVIVRVLAPEHEVVVLASAEEALGRIAAGERFDLVLCDLLLPGMTGMTFYLHLGSTAPEVVERVVFITGGATSAGAAAFLGRADVRHHEKPFASLSELRAVVRKHLQRLGGGSADHGGGSP